MNTLQLSGCIISRKASFDQFLPRSIELHQHKRFTIDGICEVVLGESNHSLWRWLPVRI